MLTGDLGMPSALIIEDNPPLAQFYSRVLEYQGFDCAWVPNCEQALTHLSEESPDLILLDVILPDGNGLDFLEKATALGSWKSPKVIVISSGDFKVEAQERGAAYFVNKPVTVERLVSIVNSLTQSA
jgi:two-component system, NtrC family, response regulator AtoC